MSDSAEETTLLYLIRHGATPSNEAVPYVLQGSGIDQSLSETGRWQASRLADFLSHIHLDAVYSSGLKRAKETAEAIASPHGINPETVEGIHEVHVGRWEGMGWAEIMEKHPEEHRVFMTNPGETPYLDGESYVDVQRRSEPAIQSVVDRHRGGRVAVIAHNVVNRAFLAPLLGRPMREAKEIRQANTGVNVIECTAEGYRLRTVNACFHLDHPFPASDRTEPATGAKS